MSSTEPASRRTRGGWVPAGTSAARRTAHASRTTAKGQRTREELVAAARRVFERDGYSKITFTRFATTWVEGKD